MENNEAPSWQDMGFLDKCRDRARRWALSKHFMTYLFFGVDKFQWEEEINLEWKKFAKENIFFTNHESVNSDLLLVAGRFSQKQGLVLREVYEEMGSPKWVIHLVSEDEKNNAQQGIRHIESLLPIYKTIIYDSQESENSLFDEIVELKKIAIQNPSKFDIKTTEVEENDD